MTESTPTTATLDPTDTTEPMGRPNTRLYQVLAWVGIVAGILFIVAVVFFSGFFAAHATGGYGWHHGASWHCCAHLHRCADPGRCCCRDTAGTLWAG